MAKPERKHSSRLSVLDRRASGRVRPHDALNLLAEEDFGPDEVESGTLNLSVTDDVSAPDGYRLFGEIKTETRNIAQELELMIKAQREAEQREKDKIMFATEEQVALFNLYGMKDENAFLHGKTGEVIVGKDKRAQARRFNRWLSTVARGVRRGIAALRAEGIAVKNRARRRQGLPPIGGAFVPETVVADFRKARQHEKKRSRREKKRSRREKEEGETGIE